MTESARSPSHAAVRWRTLLRHTWRGVAVVLVMGTVGLLLLVLAGVFHEKVPEKRASRRWPAVGDRPLAPVRVIKRPRYETAVGTVRAVHEAAVASKLLASVVEVRVTAGQAVTQGDLLVRLDDSDLQARLQQAKATVATAKALRDKAQTDHQRATQLRQQKVITQEEYDAANSALQAAQANLERAEQSVREATVILDYAQIRAPLTGVVVDKRVEAGETVAPGQVLLTIYDATRMQMVASVRESLAQRLVVGQQIPGRLEALKHDCLATVSEIVPESEATTRTILVKVTGPCPPGAYSGMFGRIFIPLDDEEVVVVPSAAVYRVGQLEMVDVAAGGELRRRSVQLGRRIDGEYEVLSGVRPGESVALRSGCWEVGR